MLYRKNSSDQLTRPLVFRSVSIIAPSLLLLGMITMFQSLLSSSPSLWVALVAVSIILVFINFYPRPPFPTKAPKLVSENYPIVGALTFFTKRWEFHHRAALQSKTGNFSYYAGPNPVIGLSGDAGREAFFGSSQLGLSEGSNL